MKIEIWSDYACPFCYIGKRHLELALKQLPFAKDIELVHKSFQLSPEAVSYTDGDIHHYISKKYNIPYAQAKTMNDQIVAQAAQVGLDYHFELLALGNTGKAHQLTKYAESIGLQEVMVERLFKAYFEEGAVLSDDETLIRLAKESGLDELAVKQVLTDETYKSVVLKDQYQAHTLKISSVPYFDIDEKYTISGAQPVERFITMLTDIYNGKPTF